MADTPTPVTPATPPTIPTVTGEPRRPVVLSDEQLAAATAPADSEDARLARAFGILDAEPAAPAQEPPPPAEPAAATPPNTAPAAAPEQRQSDTPDLADRLDRLTALERRLEERDRTLSEREKSLQKYADFEKTLNEEDALAALQKLGVSFDDLSRAAVDGRGVQSKTAVEKQVAELREQLAAIQAKSEEARVETLTQRAYREIDEGIAATSPLLAAYGELARNAVLEHMRATYQQTGGRVTLPTDQAIAAVDGEFRALVKKALAVESLRNEFLGPSQPNPATSGISDPAAPVIPGRPQTLTNGHATEIPRRSESDVMTEEERTARALRHLE